MDLRLALYELTARHGLDEAGARRLRQLAGVDAEPAAAATWLARGIAVLAAALLGLGMIFWVAANWDSLGRFGRFALLQAAVVVACVGALFKPAARVPLALAALLATGGLFAYFGQTYQTGADPWQLFALWAALTLPLCLALRSDVAWAPWALVAMTGISLWVHAHLGHVWAVRPGDLQVHGLGWIAALVLVAAFSAPARRFTGAGVWSLRTATTLTVITVTTTALFGLFSHEVSSHYGLGLLLLATGAALFATGRFFDLYGLSAIALGLDTLLVCGLARMLFDGRGGDTIGQLLVLGLVAAGLLAATVTAVLRIARVHATKEAP
ncbi:DUF2157 domain-containing protein [Ideonella sp.]|uniref:DUF2157 domain-containing protein n=1 Tax=Ideonella sp. TaxID=1929293 RepID=UPI0035AFFAB7